jgi:hypothetical protein
MSNMFNSVIMGDGNAVKGVDNRSCERLTPTSTKASFRAHMH